MKSWLFPLWVIINFLLFLVTIILWLTAPEYLTLNIALTAFTVTLALVLSLVAKKDISNFFRTAYFKKVAFHVSNVILVLSIIALLNYLGNKNYHEFDLTSEKRNSLTEQTIKVLEMVKSPLKMTIFSRREEWNSIQNLLKLYEAQSKKINLTAVDTDLRPDLVKSKNIEQNGTIVIDYQNKESRFEVTDELSVTNAILRAVRDEKINLYFTSGHDELSCDETNQEGISQLCERLKTQNYQIKTLDLTRVKDVPSDASAVLVLGPASGFLKSEIDILQKYLNRGGSMFLSLAPAFNLTFYDDLINLARPYGLTMGKDIVVDRLSTVQGAEATIPIITNYDTSHPVTAGFNKRTIFPLSASIKTLPGNDSAVLLAFTSPFPGSWAESDLKGVTEGNATFEEGKDSKGPIALLGIGESTKDVRGSRFALLGSSSFLINGYQGQSANSYLFLNTVSWLINDEGIISFNRPGLEEAPVILSAKHLQLIFFISILLVPVIFFGTAIFIYRRRRKL
jgi:ABC-type uncharacterized transport system involved in gliding motility auxiliary subunit